MPLDLEIQRTLDFVSAERKRLLPQVRVIQREREHCGRFANLVTEIFDTLDSNLPQCLDALRREAELDVDVASESLEFLYAALRAMIDFLESAVSIQESVPRELYALISWFFTRCKRACNEPAYVICAGSELEELHFGEFLSSIFLRNPGTPFQQSRFAALTDTFRDRAFFFILVPPSIFPSNRSIDWPLIFHECVHMLEDVCKIVPTLFPELPSNWDQIARLASIQDPRAREALATRELVCDYVATHIAGPIFPWRFLRTTFSISGVLHETHTHPTVDLRCSRMVAILVHQGFQLEAERANQILTKNLGDLGEFTPPPPNISLVPCSTAQVRYASSIDPFDSSAFDSQMRMHYIPNVDALRVDILRKRPVLLDPASLYTVVAFLEDCENDAISDLLADSLRLFFIADRYRSLGLRH